MIDFITNNIGMLIALWFAGLGMVCLFFHAAARLKEIEKYRE